MPAVLLGVVALHCHNTGGQLTHDMDMDMNMDTDMDMDMEASLAKIFNVSSLKVMDNRNLSFTSTDVMTAEFIFPLGYEAKPVTNYQTLTLQGGGDSDHTLHPEFIS